ncbi:GDSL-type esterase/lipase family protein [Siphonobacter sp. SORGH_AS_0500]|uniref:GDSL-type esterase/lipase family protein n=1 Tax=Siphonobacter sp. SORGH_AS_0500 TaxID=1864824 RepID=UPI00285DC231|nr:GDSL-type esterase/lipase family protein [Siphonobacter sp. SORGH_AS_0500]MDR6195068.1 lysophospholipase L1-like esterase [Siphonobacter sp. SORGH_AS_0500]
MTHIVRKRFQYEFGNAGRGFIVPFHVARTNEPYTYKTNSDVIWESRRCVMPNDLIPNGIGGVTVRNTVAGKRINVEIRSDSALGYQFDRLKLFCLRDSNSYDYNILDASGAIMASAEYADSVAGQQPYQIDLHELNDSFTLESVQSRPGQTHATIFGFSLENGQPGVLYHTVGVNGAQYSHYNESQYFAEQTRGLAPHLVIVSLGTNESHSSKLTMPELTMQIDSMVQAIQRNNPEAIVLLTTPADSYKRRTQPNAKMGEVRQTILDYANQHHLPCWDLYGITGAASFWRKNHLIGSDGVHYTRQGYEFQGNLLYQALMNAFNEYVTDRL